MRTKRFLAGAAALLLVGACAKQQVEQVEPGLELRAAATTLSTARQAGFTLTVTGSVDDLVNVLKRQAAGDGDPWSAADTRDLRTLLGSSLTVAVDQAGPGAGDDRLMVAATVGGVPGTELRVVDGVLYLKAPVAKLAHRFGGDLDSFREGAPATLDPFFAGRWVTLDPRQAAHLARSGGLDVPTGDADAEKALAELKKSAANLFRGATVTRDAADPEHLVVTSSTTQAYDELGRLLAALPGADASDLSDRIEDEAPKEQPIVLDVWVGDAGLRAAEVNLAQFVDGVTGRTALHLELTTGTPITVPQGAARIDLAALAGADDGDPGLAPESVGVGRSPVG